MKYSTVYFALLIAALYVIQIDQSKSFNQFSDEFTQLLDDSQQGSDSFTTRTERLQKMALLVHRAEEEKVDIEKMVDTALSRLDMPASYAPALTHSLIRNVRFGQQHGLFEDGNAERISRGEAPSIKNGGYDGDVAEVDQVIPHYLAPEISTNFANLVWKPKAVIEAGTDDLDVATTIQAVTELHSSTFLTGHSLNRVIHSLKSI